MATGLVNGTDLVLYVGDTNAVAVAFATSCSLEVSMDEIDQTNKESGGWKQIIGGLRSWSVSADALYQNEAEASKKAFVDFWALLDTRAEVDIEFAPQYKGIRTAQEEWCTDSCGVGMVELRPWCTTKTQEVKVLLRSGSVAKEVTVTVKVPEEETPSI